MRDQWKQIDQYLERSGLRVGQPTLGRTTGGHSHAHGPGHYSLHYAGLARDYYIGDSDAWRIAKKLEFMASDPNGPIAELFFAPLDIWYKNGQHLKSNAMRGKTQFTETESPFTVGVGGHQDHCHVALKPFRRLF
jgi:hypothetical protein